MNFLCVSLCGRGLIMFQSNVAVKRGAGDSTGTRKALKADELTSL